MKIEGRLARWLVAFGFRLLQLWARTLRYEIDDRAGIVGKPITENYVGALWHNRLLIFPLVLRRFFPQRHGAALISASRDGDLLADAVQRFGGTGRTLRQDHALYRGTTEELRGGRKRDTGFERQRHRGSRAAPLVRRRPRALPSTATRAAPL